MMAPRFGARLPGNTGGTLAPRGPTATINPPNYAQRYPGAMAAVTRAFPGGVPQQRAWIKTQAAGQGAKPAAAPGVLPAWPASGSFNPQRELEVGEAERGLGEAEREGATTQTRLGNQYATSLGEIGRQRGEETADYQRRTGEQNDAYQKGLGLLAESFQKLGTRQEEGANKAGLLQGGALLASAAARGANEAKERTKRTEANTKAIEALNLAHTRAGEGFDRQQAKLIEEGAPPDEANPAGGTKWQDLATHLANLRGNFAFFQQGQQGLAGQEAWERSPEGQKALTEGKTYPGPPAPAAPGPAPRYPAATAAVARAFPGGAAEQRAYVKGASKYVTPRRRGR